MAVVEEIDTQRRKKTDISLTSILIVDNDPVIYNLLQSQLKKIVTLVDIAENTAEAEILLQRCHFDLIIINIPPADDEVVNWTNSLREKGEQIPAIPFQPLCYPG